MPSRLRKDIGRIAPGVLLCSTIALVAAAVQTAEEHVFGYPYVEGLVAAIIRGVGIRTVWYLGQRWRPCIPFSGTLFGSNIAHTRNSKRIPCRTDCGVTMVPARRNRNATPRRQVLETVLS